MKRYLSILLIVITVFMLTACGSTSIKNGKTFTESDFEITLTNDFVKKELSGIKYYYEDNTNGILAIINVESKQLFENAGVNFPDDAYSYAEFVVKANSLSDSKVVTKGNYAQFSYKKTNNGKEYYYYATAHKAGDAYYLVNIFCFASQESEYQDLFAKWSDSIVVK